MRSVSELTGYLTASEAAALLGVSHVQVTRYVAAMRLPAKRIGRQMLIPERAVHKFQKRPRGNPNFLRKKTAKASCN